MATQSTDVLIIGGGVIGLSIARALARRGCKQVIVIDRADFGSEASSAAGGMLAPQAEADKPDVFFDLACRSRDAYRQFAQDLYDETGIDVQLEMTGTLYTAFTSKDVEEIGRRFEWQHQAGLAVQKLTATEARELEPSISPNLREALLFPKDVQVENRLLINALIISCERHGVCLMRDTIAHTVEVTARRITGVITSRGFYSARITVVAGGAWTSSIVGLLPIPIEPVRGQMLCLQSDLQIVRHVLYSPRGYVVPRRDGRLLAGSTTEHVGFTKTVTPAGIEAIKASTVEISQSISSLPIVESWAGLRPRAPDDLPVLGPCGEIEGLYYATGHYRNGILLAPITGDMIAGAIIDKQLPPLMSAFSADRFSPVSVN